MKIANIRTLWTAFPNWNFNLVTSEIALVLAVATAAVWGQETIRLPNGKQPLPSKPQVGQSLLTGEANRAPLPHLYWHFLLYQNHLDRVAAVREQQGKDGGALRTHFQKKLGFTDSQFQVVRNAGLQLEGKLKPIDEKARAIAKQDRDWRRVNGVSRSVPPPGHAQMQQLRKDHEAVIEAQVVDLNRALGSKSAAKLQSFIETDWAPHVTVHRIQSRPHDPKNHPVHQLHMEARQ